MAVTRDDAPIRALIQNLKDLKGMTVSAGSQSPSGGPAGAYPNGTPIAGVLAVHEYGAPTRGIPMRSVLRSGLIKARDELNSAFLDGAQRVLRGEKGAGWLANEMGRVMVGAMEKRIEMRIPPPLGPWAAKAAARGDRDPALIPLFDTQRIHNSLNWSVEG